MSEITVDELILASREVQMPIGPFLDIESVLSFLEGSVDSDFDDKEVLKGILSRFLLQLGCSIPIEFQDIWKPEEGQEASLSLIGGLSVLVLGNETSEKIIIANEAREYEFKPED